jgi:hypothetical protein
MSDFLKHPNFQPDEEFKKFIDGIFIVREPTKVKKEVPPPTESKLELNLPDPEELTEGQLRLAGKMASDELEQFRVAFLDFQDKVSDLGIYTHLYPNLEDFGQVCEEMKDLIDNNFNEDDLSDVGQVEYKQAQLIRARILAHIFNRYHRNT